MSTAASSATASMADSRKDSSALGTGGSIGWSLAIEAASADLAAGWAACSTGCEMAHPEKEDCVRLRSANALYSINQMH